LAGALLKQGVRDLRILASVPTTHPPRKGKCLSGAGDQRHVTSARLAAHRRVPYASYNTVRLAFLTRQLCSQYGGLILYIPYIHRRYIMHILRISTPWDASRDSHVNHWRLLERGNAGEGTREVQCSNCLNWINHAYDFGPSPMISHQRSPKCRPTVR
jgi:hypothetical protein